MTLTSGRNALALCALVGLGCVPGQPSPSVDLATAEPIRVTPAASAPTAASGWSEPVLVDGGPYREAAMAVTPTGEVHLVGTTPDGIFHLSRRGDAWSVEQLTEPGTDGYAFADSGVAVDGQSVWVSYTQLGAGSQLGPLPDGVHVLEQVDGQWARRYSQTGHSANSPALAVRDGEIHLLYVEGMPNDEGDHFPIHYAHGRVEEMTDEVVDHVAIDPSLRLPGNGPPWFAFGQEGGLIWRPGLYVWRPEGTGFAGAQVPGSTADLPYALALDSYDRPHVAYQQDGRSTLSVASWSWDSWELVDVPSSSAMLAFDLDIDADVYHLAVSSAGDGISHASYRDGRWEVELVALTPASAVRITVDDLDRLHLIFIDETGSLWYASHWP